jgi:ABC-type bacteriocin/lantibiotic exporter with double-glycine peptidase domain
MPKHLLRVLHIPQQDSADCLAACVAMMLSAIDISVEYSRLVKGLGIQPWGAPHRNILHVQRLAPNIRITYRQGELRDLLVAIDDGFPPVVFVNTTDLPYWSVTALHAVVITGYDDTHFFIHDPAFEHAPQISLQDELALAWLAHDSYFAVFR